MLEEMAQLHVTEAELAQDLHAVLAKVRQGTEVVVEQDQLPVAIIHSPKMEARLLSECISLAEARGSTVTLDEGFMRDVEEGIADRSKPWNPPVLE